METQQPRPGIITVMSPVCCEARSTAAVIELEEKNAGRFVG